MHDYSKRRLKSVSEPAQVDDYEFEKTNDERKFKVTRKEQGEKKENERGRVISASGGARGQDRRENRRRDQSAPRSNQRDIF